MADSPDREIVPRLEGIETWVFDLDNTLYPPECRLFDQIDLRMGRFISEHLGIDREAARALQKEYFVAHGTTLSGLMARHGIDPDEFLHYVHDIDVGAIAPAPALGEALSGLEGRRLVFTNGSVAHAERVLERLGIATLFEDIFDIKAADYCPKPQPLAYDRFLARHDVAPARAAMFEDMSRNLAPAAARGMTTIWLRTSYHWASVDHPAEGVHHETDDLLAFLRAQARDRPGDRGFPGRAVLR